MTNLIQHAIDAISLGSIYALIALGITLIFGIMRLVNFAHGELIMVGAYVMVFGGSLSPVLLVIAVLAAVMLTALAMERLAFRPVRQSSDTTLLVTSFAISYLLQSVAVLAIGSDPRGASTFGIFSKQIVIGGVRITDLAVITALVTFALLVALALFLRRTRIGVQMRAAAEDFRMARLVGVRANVVIAAAFAISGLLAGVVALLLVPQTGSVTPTIGLHPLLGGIVAVVVGGIGSLPGAVLGGYLFGITTVALEAYLPPSWRPYRDALVFALVIAVLLARPQGLLPGRFHEARV
jgi:branched-chain amino acid transport system permease protein